MYKVPFSKPHRKPSALPVRPVLEHGLIIFARSFEDGTRTVSFEDPAMRYDKSITSYFGKGKHVDHALLNALKHFYSTAYPTKRVMPVRRPELVDKTVDSLDSWLTAHTGVLQAVRDDDGTILIKLEGSIVPSGPLFKTAQGQGDNFYEALADGLAAFYSGHTSVLTRFA